jgi:hypothetical protein
MQESVKSRVINFLGDRLVIYKTELLEATLRITREVDQFWYYTKARKLAACQSPSWSLVCCGFCWEYRWNDEFSYFINKVFLHIQKQGVLLPLITESNCRIAYTIANVCERCIGGSNYKQHRKNTGFLIEFVLDPSQSIQPSGRV